MRARGGCEWTGRAVGAQGTLRLELNGGWSARLRGLCLLFASQKCWAQKQSYPRSTLLLDPLDNFIISHKNPETAQKLALLPLLSNDSDWWQQLNLCRVHAWQVQLTWRMETGGWTGVRVLQAHTHPPLRSPAKTISTRVYLGCTVEIRTPSPSSVSNGAATLVSL